MTKDTIYSLATPPGRGSIAIVRISGERAKEILESIFTGEIKSHKLSYGTVCDGQLPIDQCMAVFMQSPRTYTREDVAELHLHGGPVIVREVLAMLARLGLRQAEPGEFTKRAFLNGRIDLSQAEAVMDMIQAESTRYQQIALQGLTGGVKNAVEVFSDRTLDLLAQLDVCIDYPEEDIEEETKAQVGQQLETLIEDIQKNLSSKLAGQVITGGYKIALVGRPNVGKSSLLNAILGKDKVIVTDIPGTTRDALDESFTYKGMLFTFIDTAGIRESKDEVEKIGIQKSYQMLEQANLVVCVLDGSAPLTKEDKQLLEQVQTKEHLVVLNKSDLGRAADAKGIAISAKDNDNIQELLKQIYEKANETIGNVGVILNDRHVALAKSAISSFQDALSSIYSGEEIECIEIDIKDGWKSLSEITGAVYDEQIINRIFERFCLGK